MSTGSPSNVEGHLSVSHSPSPSTPSNDPDSGNSPHARRSEHSRLSVPSLGGKTPIVAVTHRYQRSWKSRLAASMRQARDFLSRPRAIARSYSTRRHNNAVAREELLKGNVKIDINVATKHELAHLPGVDSSLASAIIDYRKLIVGNRFKRVEDLINVPGLDIAKLDRIREFIIITKPIKMSPSDSEEFRSSKTAPGNLNNESPTFSVGTQSSDSKKKRANLGPISPNFSEHRLSLAGGTQSTPLAATTLLNINKATEYDFVHIAGIPPDVAKKIVMARQNIGPFHAVTDLKRVKGVSKSIYLRVRDRLAVEEISRNRLLPNSMSVGNIRPSETDSGVATTLSIVAGGSSGGPPSGSTASANNSKQVSPNSDPKDIDLNNLPDVIIKYSKPSDLELIHRLQVNTQGSSRINRVKPGVLPRGHSRNVSDIGALGEYSELLNPLYPSDMQGIRPLVEPFDFKAEDGNPVVRFAFWDIEDCGMEKISNPGVLETLCMTILETGLSIIAFADITDAGVVDRIADQLTWPSLHCVREWRGPRGSWRGAVIRTGYRNNCETYSRAPSSSCSSIEGDADTPVYCGFVFDTSKSISMVDRSHYSSPLQQLSRNAGHLKTPRPECLNVSMPKTALHKLAYRPAAAKFCLSTPSMAENGDNGELSHIAVVCVKLSPDDSAFFRRRDVALSTGPLLTALLESVSTFSEGSKTPMPIVLAGSFGVDAGEHCFDLLRVAGYQLSSQERTNISRKQLSGSICGDHVWITDLGEVSFARQFTGKAGVVRKALSHPQIPDGWAWGGFVSSHCPVWAEFYTSAQPTSEINNNNSSKSEN